MSVSTLYIVERKGATVLSTKNKKEAEKHDKMLDVAENLTPLFDKPAINFLSESEVEDICILLSKNSDVVQKILKGASYTAACESKEPLKKKDKSLPN